MAVATRAAWRNRQEFDGLVTGLYTTVFAVAMARLQSREAAEDLAQEVFLRAFLQFDPALGAERFGPWVICVTRRLATDWAERQQRRSELVAAMPIDREALSVTDNQPSAADQLHVEEQTRILDTALAKLTPEEREVVLLHFYEDLPKATIASRLGVHPSTVGRQIDRALVALQAGLRPLLRPGRRSAERTLGVVSAAAAMSATAKSQLLASEAFRHGTAVAVAAADAASGNSLISKGTAVAVQGAMIVGKAKLLVGAAMIAVVAAGGYYGLKGNGSSSVTAGPAAVPNTQKVFTSATDPDLPEGWVLKVADAASGTNTSINTGSKFTAQGVFLLDALNSAWPKIDLPPEVGTGVNIQLQKNIELLPPSPAPYDKLLAVLQKEIPKVYGIRVTPSTRGISALVLKLPGGKPAVFRPAVDKDNIAITSTSTVTNLHGYSMGNFAQLVSNSRKEKVVDETGLKGSFDVDLNGAFHTDNALRQIGFTLERRPMEATYLKVDPR